MDIFIKSVSCILVGLIAYLILKRQGNDFSVLVSLAVCVMIAIGCIQLLSPLRQLFDQLMTISKIDIKYFQIILKAVGIGLLSEITMLICNDAGNAAMGKTLELLATVVILVISLPLFTALIELFNSLLFTT